jgi:hypothetical protein
MDDDIDKMIQELQAKVALQQAKKMEQSARNVHRKRERLQSDKEYRKKLTDQQKLRHQERYKTDPEYRERILQARRLRYARKKENLANMSNGDKATVAIGAAETSS